MASNIPADELTCPVCFEIYRRPKVLSCGHTFCQECIHEYIMKKTTIGILTGEIDCLLCRKLTKVEVDHSQPEIWAGSLCSNFALESILATPIKTPVSETEGSDQPKIETKYVCQPCLDENGLEGATVFCTDCCQFQCADCAKCHKKFGVTKEHTLIDIEGNEEEMEFLSSIRQLQLCDKHDQEIVNFCSTHRTLCCNTCHTESHRDCKIIQIGTWKSNRLKTMQRSVRDLYDKLELAAQFWVARFEVKNERNALLRNINTRRERVNKEFDKLEKEAIRFLENENVHRNSMYHNNLGQCKQLSKELDQILTDLKFALRFGTQRQTFILAHRLQDRVESFLSRSEEEFSKLKRMDVMIQYKSFMNQLTTADEGLARLEVSDIKVPINEIGDFVSSSLRLNSKANQNASSFYRSIDFLSDGRLVAVDHPKRKLLLFDRELNCIYEKELKYTPLSVKTLPIGNSFVVTTGEAKRLLYFKERKKNPGFSVSTKIIKNACDSIAPINNTSFFVRLFGGKKPLGVVENYSNEKDVFIDLPEKEYTVDSTKIAFDTVSQKLAISDKRTDTVYIVDNIKQTMVTVNSKEIIHPRGVVFGGDDSLYICSDGTDSIVRVSTSGEVLSIRKLTMSNPYAICISKDKRQLAVTNIGESNKQIQVLDIV